MQIFEQKPTSGEKAKHLIVMLHGLGSNGEDLFGLVRFLEKFLPDCHFYAPNGVEKFDMGPFGYQWFSLRDRNIDVIKKSLLKSLPLVQELIKQKLDELSLEYKDLILIGFSQGAMLSMYIAHHLHENIKAVVAFSGRFYPPEQVNSNNTPTCLIHGTEDEVVEFDALEKSKKLLYEVGNLNVEAHAIENLAHSIDTTALMKAQSFIIKHLSE